MRTAERALWVHAQLDRALDELGDDETPPDVAALSVRTYALAMIALELRRLRMQRHSGE